MTGCDVTVLLANVVAISQPYAYNYMLYSDLTSIPIPLAFILKFKAVSDLATASSVLLNLQHRHTHSILSSCAQPSVVSLLMWGAFMRVFSECLFPHVPYGFGLSRFQSSLQVYLEIVASCREKLP